MNDMLFAERCARLRAQGLRRGTHPMSDRRGIDRTPQKRRRPLPMKRNAGPENACA
ncbi:MAG: hypothetical protein ACLUI3_15910 [Christensenellales bacterium]